MELIIKFYDSITDTLPKEQIEYYNSIDITENLTSYSYADIDIPLVIWLEELNIVRIYEILDSDTLLFEWYIDSITPWVDNINIQIKDYKWLLQRKLIVENKTYIAQTPKQIIDDLILYYNWLGDNWLSISGVWTTINKDIVIGDNIYDVINEIANELQCQWIIYWSTIYFETLVWDDLTSWINFTEIIYNWIDYTENNINNIWLKNYWNIANIIVWIDQSDNKVILTDSTSITNYWPLSKKISFRDWNLTENTQAYLDLYKEPQKIYNIEIEPFTIDVKIWDKVNTRIEETNEYLNYNWDSFIIIKNTKIENATKIITYWVSTVNIKLRDFIQLFRDIEWDINYLSL